MSVWALPQALGVVPTTSSSSTSAKSRVVAFTWRSGQGVKACYSPVLDYVKLPQPSGFQLPEEYYSTAFHELTHSTGHAKRVGRKGILEPSYFGSHEYSKEELVAEMGAAFLCGHAGYREDH